MTFSHFSFLRFILSLLLSLIVYGGLILFFFLFINHRREIPKPIIVHAFIPGVKKSIHIAPKQQISIQPPVPTSKPTVKKVKIGGKSATTKSGENIKVEELFQGVNFNTPTTPVKRKAYKVQSRLKGDDRLAKLQQELQKRLSLVKAPAIQLNPTPGGGGTISNNEANEIYQKMAKVWYEVYSLPNQYAVLDVSYNGGQLQIEVVDSNLPPPLLKQLIYKLKQLIFTKPFSLRVRFIAKKSPN